MIYRAYEWALLRRITLLPGNICFMIPEEDLLAAPGKISEVSRWCTEINGYCEHRICFSREEGGDTKPCICTVTFHISVEDPRRVDPVLQEIRTIAGFARLTLHIGDTPEVRGRGMDVVVVVGKSGRDEIVSCIRKMAAEHLDPEMVDEQTFERYLTFPTTPDMILKTGGYHLTDFLIWQSVYSELFFSDVNWRSFRKTDFLRALRDYQARKRRFGK
ncbi:MAG: undecaprenyl diphosphate synthase family protein [Methanoregulaceae archaeon]|nr:undecaprenyl diphosphate synthase family protein [Methanoregulaceae archaeon]